MRVQYNMSKSKSNLLKTKIVLAKKANIFFLTKYYKSRFESNSKFQIVFEIWAQENIHIFQKTIGIWMGKLDFQSQES